MSELEEAMRSDDPEERRRATSALPSAPDGDRGALLIRALGDVDWRVRKEGARVAASVAEDRGHLPELVDGLCQGENVGLRNSALEVLERLGPRAANALLVALPRVPEAARKFVVAALGFAGGAGVEKLAELSRDAEPNTAQAAIEALARVGGDRAEEALRGHLEAEDPVQRLAALEGLERLQAQVSLDALAPLLGDRLVRRLALRILGYSEEPGAAATLLGALEDGGAASLEATVALGRLLTRGGPAAREMAKLAEGLSEPVRKHLRTVAQSGRDEARRAATWVLLLARDEHSLGAAAELAADDRLPPVALDVIRRWGGSAIRPLVDASSELSPRGRAIALQMASDLAARAEPAPDVLRSLRAALRALLSSDEATVVAAGAEALGRWAAPADSKLLLRAARVFPEPVARAAGRALERLASSAPDAVEAELSSVPLDGQLGAALLPAVAALGGQSATDLLQATLNADDPRARRAAVRALPRRGGERAVELAAQL
ncbi:MAG: HEAT repeat domain-containing protein, partial [Sandaracinaceae bacterium]